MSTGQRTKSKGETMMREFRYVCALGKLRYLKTKTDDPRTEYKIDKVMEALEYAHENNL